MTDIATLTKLGYTIFNVNKQKAPVHNGVRMMGWNKMPHDELTKKLDINSNMFGMRMGIQGNKKHILSLDFDCCKKQDDGTYIYCKDTAELFDNYLWNADGCHHGVFDSSTERNKNVLIDYSNCPKLISTIQDLDTAKITYLGLEILLGGNQVIPPTMTKCKMRDKFITERKFWTNEEFYVMADDECTVGGFINKMINNSNNKKVKKVKKVNKKIKKLVIVSDDKDTALLDIISMDYWDEFDSWKKIIWAMKNEGYTKAVAMKYSKRSDRFTEEAFDNVWDKSPSTITNTQGTINYYAKLSNPTEYDRLNIRKDISLEVLEKGALCIANVIYSDLQENLIYCNKNWYTVDEKTNLWRVIEKPSYIVVSTIHSYLKESCSILFDEIQNTDDPETKKTLSAKLSRFISFYKTCDNAGFLSNMFNHLTMLLRDDDFTNKLDNNPGYLAYKNGIYNIKDDVFIRGIKQSDYITRTIPFNYKVAKKEEIAFMEDVLLKICNDNVEHRDYYLSCLGYSLLGKPHLQKAVYYLIGQGGDNGKTLILDSLSEIAPCYAAKIERKTLEKNYTKAHKHLKNLHGRRICYVEELEKGKKQNVELIKELADGKSISNEVMYGTDETINILSKWFILGNHTPAFESDGGMANRLRQQQFINNFGRNNKEERIENGIHYYVPDLLLSDKIKTTYKHALLSLLIKWGRNFELNGMPDIPEMFVRQAEQTLTMNDGFASWFTDNCKNEIGARCGKEELIEVSGYKIRELNDELARLGYKYDKHLRIGGYHSRGGWRGFKINDEDPPSDVED